MAPRSFASLVEHGTRSSVRAEKLRILLRCPHGETLAAPEQYSLWVENERMMEREQAAAKAVTPSHRKVFKSGVVHAVGKNATFELAVTQNKPLASVV